jgi:DNA-binding transcriptional MerR regulator
MRRFSVNELATLAGVSVRTLHHYDEIGLLEPATRTESKYRYYGEPELLRLQQILFYKELGLPLAQVKDILDDVSFDTEQALRSHKQELLNRRDRVNELLRTIDKTISHLKTKKMKFEDMYKGFSKEQAEAYEKEAKERWGTTIVEESKQRVLKMGKEGLDALRREGDAINNELCLVMHLSPEDEKVQQLVKRHFNMTNKFYTVTREIYQGLGEMYVADERFKQNYEKYKEGLAEFLRDAIHVFCRNLTS